MASAFTCRSNCEQLLYETRSAPASLALVLGCPPFVPAADELVVANPTPITLSAANRLAMAGRTVDRLIASPLTSVG